MPRLAFNYMRPLAVLVLLAVTFLIFFSFFLIPKIFVLTLPDFYHRYWCLLSWLFLISFFLVLSAFFIENPAFPYPFLGHLIIIVLLILFVLDICRLLKVGNIFFAFMN